MDIEAVRLAILDIAERHRAALESLPNRQYSVLEVGAVFGIAEHYRSNGFKLTYHNPAGGEQFVAKQGTRGNPWNFSRIIASRAAEAIEIHTNLSVQGAHDTGIYCVDVGIAQPGQVPSARPKKPWKCLPNKRLISFAEVKRLVVFPMLLAQFLGIVHEIKPQFLKKPKPRGFGRNQQLPPTLIVLGHYSGNSSEIVSGFKKRGVSFHVAEAYDRRLAAVRGGQQESPIFWDTE